MKKYIKYLGITLLFVTLLSSCSTKELYVQEPELEGLYKLQTLTVATPIDPNRDGVFNTDITKELKINYFDLVQYQYETNGIVTFFSINNTSQVREYKYDKINSVINISSPFAKWEPYEDVKISYTNDGKKKLFYKQWTPAFSQMVYFSFISVN